MQTCVLNTANVAACMLCIRSVVGTIAEHCIAYMIVPNTAHVAACVLLLFNFLLTTECADHEVQ
jgi:hypothetical protein